MSIRKVITHETPIYSKPRDRDRAKVADDHQVEIVREHEPAKLVGYSAETVLAPPVSRPALDDAAILVVAIDKDFRRAWHILQLLPDAGHYITLKTNGSGALAAKWLETMANKHTDYADAEMVRGPDGLMRLKHAPPRVRPARPSHADVSFMDRMFELILMIGDPWSRRLVWFRAARTSWSDICKFDVEQRRERWLREMHRRVLAQLIGPWHTANHK